MIVVVERICGGGAATTKGHMNHFCEITMLLQLPCRFHVVLEGFDVVITALGIVF